MLNARMLDDYYNYILNIVDFGLPEHRKYSKLMYELNNIEFTWVLPMDENRDMDAIELRRSFLIDNGYDEFRDLWDTPRSVLEVLIAFSKRIEIEITGEPGEDCLGRWFWVMLKNLDVLMVDRRFDIRVLRSNIDVWLLREFDESGRGSIFPLKNWRNDQRKTDMWYQMHAYIHENWEF